MYQPFNLTDNLLLIHRTMVDGELRRTQANHMPRRGTIEPAGPLDAVRRVAARGLTALGSRLDSPAGTPAPAVSSPKG